MAQLLADKRDVDFVLYEQLNIEEITKSDIFSQMNKKMFDMVVSEARNLAIKEILPTNAEGDKEGVRLENGKVRVPECYYRPFRFLLDGEWNSLNESPEAGGQGLPTMIQTAALEYLWGANYCLVNYGTMGHGTGKMIELFGTQEQKDLYLKKLYTGKWGGTMLLTESEAGSDVGALTTTAVKNEDGTYSITGNKIFITNGEHDLTENIIHPVLARVEGAPEGTPGISIFIVPKILVNPDKTLGEQNDIVCTGIEEKMGIHGSATCTMAMGGKNRCTGYLLGEENQGMKIMFKMMNEARFNVGFQAFTYASSAYLYAADYAKKRVQGKDVEAGKNSPAVTIINHPDVRRMLMWMKSHVDGMRSFIYYVSSLFDKNHIGKDPEENAKNQRLIDFFIPLIKGYCSQRSFEVCIQGMQVFGGYGYTSDYPMEQLVRDCKITSIYEGTDGIQAMDLVGRKLTMEKGKLFDTFLQELESTLSEASQYPDLKEFADQISKAAERLKQVGSELIDLIYSNNIKTSFSFAFPFLESTGDIIMSWMLIWRASVAKQALDKGVKNKDKAYYEGMVSTLSFFTSNVLPVTMGRMNAISGKNISAIEISDACFGG